MHEVQTPSFLENSQFPSLAEPLRFKNTYSRQKSSHHRRFKYNPDGKYRIPDLYRPPLDVTVGQMLGMFKSLDRGLKPDSPSVEGVIHRVVEGIKIYDRPEFMKNGEFKVIAG